MELLTKSELISVIIPVYNVEEYLPECIESVIMQTYSNLEIIIVNDGSTDNSPVICEDYAKKDKRIRVIHKENGGQATARNIALDVITGNYVTFVDSDDYIDKDMYECMLIAMQNEKADIVMCGSSVFTFGRRINNSHYKQMKIFDNQRLIEEYLSTDYVNNSLCNKLYKKNIFENIRMPEMRAKEDAYVMPEILTKSKKAVHIGINKYVQRVRMSSTERSKFSENKLSAIDCAINLQSHIKKTYPAYYHYIETELAKRIAELMKDIVRSFQYNKYKELYSKLYSDLVKELDKQKEKKVNEEKWKEYRNILNYHFIFLWKNKMIGLKIYSKNLLRNIK